VCRGSERLAGGERISHQREIAHALRTFQELEFRVARWLRRCRRSRHAPANNNRTGEAVMMKSMEDMFYFLMQDVYYAEKQLTRALPKMAKEAEDEELKQAFTNHLEETEGHIQRLEKAFGMIDKTARARKCDAILGIIEEGKEVMEKAGNDKELLDAGLIASGQAAEHYEIARYGTLCAWAKLLDKPQIARLLHETLEEEKKADALLSQIAERSVNQHAMHA
jgi:ferritin-like metal-binding protein YciE